MEGESHSMLQNFLTQLPADLGATYGRILNTIDSHQSEYVHSILQWLTLSNRPLRVEELTEALRTAVDGSPTFDTDQLLTYPFDVLRICRSLVTITDKSGSALEEPTHEDASDQQDTDTERFFALAHYTVKEYLLSDNSWNGGPKAYGIEVAASNTLIAKSCLIYLLQFQEQDCLSIETLREHSFADYAARFWTVHAQAAEQEATSMYKLIRQLFSPTSAAYLNWIRIHNLDRPWTGINLRRSLHEVPAPLYYASLAGLTAVVQLLLNEAEVDVSAKGGYYGNALQAASYQDHENVVKLLLESGADPNAQGGFYGNALQAASKQIHESVVQLLLCAGADVNAQGGEYGNALRAAALADNEKVIQILLAYGAYVKGWGFLWTGGPRGHTYSHVSRLLRDIEGATFTQSSISMTFECEILTVMDLGKPQLGVRREHCVDELLNHVVLVARPATIEQSGEVEALTCLEYIKRRWDSLGEQVLRDISELCKSEPGSKLKKCKFKISASQVPR